MKLNRSRHLALPFRVHELAKDFELLDVWQIPIVADPKKGESFDDFVELAVANGYSTDSVAARSLFTIRAFLGQLMGWDGAQSSLPIPGCTETSIVERLTADDRARSCANPGEAKRLPFANLVTVYQYENEALFEFSNETIHGLIHMSWVDFLEGKRSVQGKTPRLAVYIKSRGAFSRVYMAMIEPFRNAIVYPALMRSMALRWNEATMTA